ncbi:hypothetical protein BJ741DRAFT_640046, partial [Chytriomyces cf. hyalinus JEL632]
MSESPPTPESPTARKASELNAGATTVLARLDTDPSRSMSHAQSMLSDNATLLGSPDQSAIPPVTHAEQLLKGSAPASTDADANGDANGDADAAAEKVFTDAFVKLTKCLSMKEPSMKEPIAKEASMTNTYKGHGQDCTGIAVLNKAFDDTAKPNNISPTSYGLKNRQHVINTIHADVQHTLYNRSTRFRYLEQIEDAWNTWLVAKHCDCTDKQHLSKYAQDALKTEVNLRMRRGDDIANNITLESLEKLEALLTSETLTSETLEKALKEANSVARRVVMTRLCREFKQAKSACDAISAISRASNAVDTPFEDKLKQYWNLKVGSKTKSDKSDIINAMEDFLKGSGLTHIQQEEIKRYTGAMEILVRSNLDPQQLSSEDMPPLSVEHLMCVLAFWGHELDLIEQRIDGLLRGSSKKHQATDTMPTFLSTEEKNELSKYRSLFDQPNLGPLMQQILYCEHKGSINLFWSSLETLSANLKGEITGTGNKNNNGKEGEEGAGENDDDDGDGDGNLDADTTLMKFVAKGTITAFSIVGAVITALGAPSVIGKLVTNVGTWLVQGITDNLNLTKGIVAILTDSTTFLNVLLDAESQLRKMNSSHSRGGSTSQDLEFFYREKKRVYGSLLVPLEGKLKDFKREGEQGKEPEKSAFSFYSCFSRGKSYAKVSTKIGGEDVAEYLTKAKEEMVAIREEIRDRVQSHISIMSAEISNKLDKEKKKLESIEDKINKGDDKLKTLSKKIQTMKVESEELLVTQGV